MTNLFKIDLLYQQRVKTIQKQPSTGVLKKGSFEKFSRNSHKKFYDVALFLKKNAELSLLYF